MNWVLRDSERHRFFAHRCSIGDARYHVMCARPKLAVSIFHNQYVFVNIQYLSTILYLKRHFITRARRFVHN
jgi:hypothetical protein